MDAETEKSHRIKRLLNLTPSYKLCSYCNSTDIEYFCYHINCCINACKKCSDRQGYFKRTWDVIWNEPIKSNNKIFWHCNRYKMGKLIIEKGYWLDENTFILSIIQCDNCKNGFYNTQLDICPEICNHPETEKQLKFCNNCLVSHRKGHGLFTCKIHL